MQRRWRVAFIDLAQAIGCGFASSFLTGSVLTLFNPDATFFEIYDLVAFEVINLVVFAGLMIWLSLRRHRQRPPPRSGLLDYHDGT
jgi:hypothetical protein